MTKRQYNEFSARREIQDAGWKLDQQDKIAFNSGSETTRHIVCKALVAQYLKHEKGLRVDSEVEHNDRGEIDIVGYGSDGAPIAVECETSPTDEIVQDKLERYVHGTIFRECFVLPVNQMPSEIMEAYKWVSEQI